MSGCLTRLPSLTEIRDERARRSFGAFVETTVNFRLDPWQRVLCERLQRLKDERGQRLLIHAPPQWGKSILVSQRFPAWLLGHCPEERVKLACYNITHATRFGAIVRDVMLGADYRRIFPDLGLRIKEGAARAEWSTAARAALEDSQPSFMALGLLTGFVGQGADTLIIDDPYASPQDAASEAVRDSVWTFWNESARVRLGDDANVVVMFHRYHEEDLAGRLAAQGGWERLRFAAVADGEEEWLDPLGREVGERLSPRMSDAYLERQQEDRVVWDGQFQGLPTGRQGDFFKVDALEFINARDVPPLVARCRAWDLGATEGAGSYTCGVEMGRTADRRPVILDTVYGQWNTGKRDERIKETAKSDGQRVRQRFPQDPGAAGKAQAQALIGLVVGYPAVSVRVTGSKEVRADPFSSQVNAGRVLVVRAPWNGFFKEALRTFPKGKVDDPVDAAADAFNELFGSKPADEPMAGGERNQIGVSQIGR